MTIDGSTRATGQTGGLGVVAAMSGGFLLLLLSWTIAVAPLGGSDQFDHLYRASGVAHGEWLPAPEAATRGTGAFIVVPDDLVQAARAQCQDLDYTGPAECIGTPAGPGQRRVASGAGRYNPLYYAAVGYPSLPFDGVTAYRVMQLVSLALCAGLFAAGVWVTGLWARSRWPIICLLLACSPVVLYSGSLVAPNGVEMMAGLLLWTVLLGFGRTDPRHTRSLLVLGTLAAGALVTTRSLGPLWCVLVIGAVVLARWSDRGTWLERLRSRGGAAAMTAVGLAAVGSVCWTLGTGALDVGAATDRQGAFSLSERIGFVPPRVVEWFFASIAAFPHRNEPSHPLVYVLYLLLFVGVVSAGLRYAGFAQRAAIVGVAATTLVFPAVVLVATYNSFASPWQGRYGLPLSMGILVLAGHALDRAGRDPDGRTTALVVVAFVLAQATALGDVLHRQTASSVLRDDPAWWHPDPVVLGIVGGLSAALACLPLLRRGSPQQLRQ